MLILLNYEQRSHCNANPSEGTNHAARFNDPTHPDAASALREISLDRLGFTQCCTQDYQGQGIIPLQLGDELFCLLTNPDYITQVLKDRLSFIKAKDL